MNAHRGQAASKATKFIKRKHTMKLKNMRRMFAILATSLLAAIPAQYTLATGSDPTPKMNGKLEFVKMADEDVLYTGKPYDKDLGTYAFNYRNYHPEFSRWTSADPSEFPDGANNAAYVAIPTTDLDFLGLYSLQGQTLPNLSTLSFDHNERNFVTIQVV